MRSYLPDFDLLVASDLADALRLSNSDYRPIAGGTDLMVLFNAGRLPFRKLVSVAKVPEFGGITVSPDSVTLGAAATFSAIQRHPILQDEFPLLCRAASWTGSAANQNRATIGGNIANASPAADSLPALLVYDAELVLVSEVASRRVAYADFHTGYKAMQLRRGELIAKVHLPRTRRELKQYARKVGTRRAQAISKVCFNALAEMDGDVIKHIRIGVGSIAPVPLRCHKTEAALMGQTVTGAIVGHAREVIAQEIQPIDDIRSTAAYRSLVTQNLLGEFLGTLR
jgi:CO/xanthine dehydrogenase FAD-binding subunit